MPYGKRWIRFYYELQQELLSHGKNHKGLLTSVACNDHEEVIIWLAIAQLAFDAWFQMVYYRTARRSLRKRNHESWALVPIKFDDQVHDWPIRQCWWPHFPELGVDRRNFLTTSNYFRCWQRMCFRIRALAGQAQIVWELSLKPLADLHELDDHVISRILRLIMVYENDCLY
jgi:hypothetical protein